MRRLILIPLLITCLSNLYYPGQNGNKNSIIQQTAYKNFTSSKSGRFNFRHQPSGGRPNRRSTPHSKDTM
jgi:hypothetical protein